MKISLSLFALAFGKRGSRSTEVTHEHKGHPGSCPQGHFKIGNMKDCRPWLTCDDVDQIR